MFSFRSIFRTKPKSVPGGTVATKEQMERFLAKYDTSQDRHLNKSELKAVFEELGAYLPARRAERALAVADKDGDGHISFSELRGLLNYAIEQGYEIRFDSTP